MSALSQSLLFTKSSPIGSTATVEVVYPNTATSTVVFVSEKTKGNGYYGASNGLHTVMYAASSSFVGTITMQATLASSPNDADWFNISDSVLAVNSNDTSTESPVAIYNFTGNFVWVRGQILIDQGSVYSVQYNR
jgi:hypothetical protein